MPGTLPGGGHFFSGHRRGNVESERFWRDLSAEFLELHGTAPTLYAVFDSSTPAEVAALVAAAGTKATKAITRATAIHRALSALSESVADADHRNRALRVHRAKERAHQLEEHAYNHARYAARGALARLAGHYDRELWVIGEGTQARDALPGVSERRFRLLAERAAIAAGQVKLSASDVAMVDDDPDAEEAVQAWLHLLARRLVRDRSPFMRDKDIERLSEASALLCERFATDAYRRGLAPNSQKLEANSPAESTVAAGPKVSRATSAGAAPDIKDSVRMTAALRHRRNLVRKLCKDRGMTMPDLARFVRIDESSIRAIIRGDRSQSKFNDSNLQTFLERLGISGADWNSVP